MKLPAIIKQLFANADADADANGTDDDPGRALDGQQTDQDSAHNSAGRAMVGQLQRERAEHPAQGLTPARLYEILEGAEDGDLKTQHELFADMEEKDPQILSDLGKRRQSAASLEWQITAPDNASRDEQRATDLCREVFEGLEVEDLIIELGDGIGHGWVNLELPWDTQGTTRIITQPLWRPHGWFQLHQDHQNELRLRDGSGDGAELWPLGWIQHRHRAKSGYVARSGLMRTLVWPYLFKNYSVGDLAELLEIYGIPARLGKYPANAKKEEKATLLKAVVNLGHSAAGIIPEGMSIDFMDAADGKADLFAAMLNWTERGISKAILGGTLTTGTDAGSGAFALGQVHERGLGELIAADARQYAGSIQRYLLWPMAALNYGINERRRAPQFFLDTGEVADYKALADAVPVFVSMGARIARSWLHEKTRIPEAGEGEDILTPVAATPPPGGPGGAATPDNPATPATPPAPDAVALKAALQTGLGDDLADPYSDQLQDKAAKDMTALIAPLKRLVMTADSLEALRDQIYNLYQDLPSDQLAALMAEGMNAAQLGGMTEVEEGR